MKNLWTVAVLLMTCVCALGAVSNDQLKEFKHLVKMDSVRDYEEGSGTDKKQILKVEFSSETEGLEDILVRMAVEMTDKKTKQVYLAQEMRSFGEMPEGYDGEGYWELSLPYGDFDKLKMTAYVVEFGVLDGDVFVPFLTECDHAESFDELIKRSAQKFPNLCKLYSLILVDK